MLEITEWSNIHTSVPPPHITSTYRHNSPRNKRPVLGNAITICKWSERMGGEIRAINHRTRPPQLAHLAHAFRTFMSVSHSIVLHFCLIKLLTPLLWSTFLSFWWFYKVALFPLRSFQLDEAIASFPSSSFNSNYIIRVGKTWRWRTRKEKKCNPLYYSKCCSSQRSEHFVIH